MPGAALRCLPGLVLLLTVLLPPRVAPAQGLPEMAPLNPVSSSRSGLYFQPLREPAPGRWVKAVALDYGSSIEYNQVPPADYVLDSELMRLTLALSRDLGSGTFLKLDAGLGGAYAGFMDGILDWYHGALGIRMAERERRPKDRFLYEITLPDGRILERSRNSLFLEDTRIGLGYHLSPILQTVLTATLPTSTGPAGYGRGVPSVGLLNTLSTPMSARVYYEGSANLGYTPRHGALKELQTERFLALTSGVRVAVWGRQSLFANLFYHSPYYHDTTLPSLDRRELSLDFGWIVHSRAGGEWRVGMTEDLEPGGPGIDLIFRFGRAF